MSMSMTTLRLFDCADQMIRLEAGAVVVFDGDGDPRDRNWIQLHLVRVSAAVLGTADTVAVVAAVATALYTVGNLDCLVRAEEAKEAHTRRDRLVMAAAAVRDKHSTVAVLVPPNSVAVARCLQQTRLQRPRREQPPTRRQLLQKRTRQRDLACAPRKTEP